MRNWLNAWRLHPMDEWLLGQARKRYQRKSRTKRSTGAADHAGFEIIGFWRRSGYRNRNRA
jgi:hypothetical protein